MLADIKLNTANNFVVPYCTHNNFHTNMVPSHNACHTPHHTFYTSHHTFENITIIGCKFVNKLIIKINTKLFLHFISSKLRGGNSSQLYLPT